MRLSWEEAEVAALEASEYGTLCPVGCGMNQGQGQVSFTKIKRLIATSVES